MNLLKNKYSLSILILIELTCFVALIFVTVYVLKKQNLANEQLNIAINLRYTSFLLADQLRQSSDDLTRMVRTYAATRDSKFKEYFYMILNIRDGKVPRPENYDRIFWDFKVAEETIYSSEDGERISLDTLMKNAGFSNEEFKLLAEAKRRSDKLVKMEEIAMNAMKGKFKDDKGIFTIIKEPDRELAIQILFSKEYHLAKKDIMKPINDFLIAIDNRTSHTLTEAQKEIRSLSLALIYLFCFLVIFVPIFILTIYRYRRISEVELRKSERRYRDLYESAPNAYFSVNPVNGSILRCNLATSHLLGFDKETILQMKVFDFYADTPHGLPKAQVDFKRFKAGETIRDVELQMKHMDGNLIWISLSVDALKDDKGNVKESRSMVIDITERKQAEEALRKSEEKYRLLIENATDAIFVIQDELVKFPNPKGEEMTGYSKEELLKISFINLIHPDDRDMVLDRHKRRLSGEALPETYDFRIINKAGEELWTELNTVLIDWEERPATLNFLRDITQQKKLEAQLMQAQKMEAIGTLAGGIAHDFNNLLMVIQGNTSLVMVDMASSHPHYEHFKGIEKNVESAANLTRQLLGFARGGKYDVKPTNLNEVVNKSINMFGRTKKEVIIHKKSEKELWTVEVDQGQIEQVLLNLYVNAWQAMSGTREIYLETENVSLDASFVKHYGIEPGRYVKISVVDTGIGMDEATRNRVFDPFFTTKEMDRGTGLGLASAYGIIKNHDGIINVYSEKGKGAAFNIYLPVTDAEGIAQRAESERRSEILRGTETVLLVDDEEIIIDVGQDLLTTLGYTVLLAKSGREAIEIYKKNKDKIDMVLLDMIMPEMGGSETYDSLKEINPNLKILLSSGYSIDGHAKTIIAKGCDGFIQKPFGLKNLSHKLREILDKK